MLGLFIFLRPENWIIFYSFSPKYMPQIWIHKYYPVIGQRYQKLLSNSWYQKLLIKKFPYLILLNAMLYTYTRLMARKRNQFFKNLIGSLLTHFMSQYPLKIVKYSLQKHFIRDVWQRPKYSSVLVKQKQSSKGVLRKRCS